VKHRTLGLVILFIIALSAATLRILIDRDPIDGLGLAWPDPAYAHFRFTALLMGAVVGSSLAVAGVLLQALLRNPLASPFILGLSSGAGLGVMLAMYIGYVTGREAMVGGTNAGPALLGALAVLAIVYSLGRQRGLLDPISLVLVGVVVSAICGAVIMFLQRLVPGGLRGDILTWMMGQVPQGIERLPLMLVTLLAIAGMLIAASMGRAMDAATLGDDEARSIGLSIGPLRLAMFVLAGALTAASVSVAGPIAFVGLVAPHAARLLIGPRHGMLVFASALAGAALIIAADVASQALEFGAGRMPVGIFTALIGGPAFIWLLKHRHVAGV
jgi:iron complex transport system permease protein